LDDTRRKCGFFILADLNGHEGEQENTSSLVFSCSPSWPFRSARMKKPHFLRVSSKIETSGHRGLFQEYWVPPHWRARRRQTMAGRKKNEPIGSNSLSRVFLH
jgi:hypothetical protein